MAATGRARSWREHVQRNVSLPVAYDRIAIHADDAAPFCLSLKSVEGLTPKVKFCTNEELCCPVFLDLSIQVPATTQQNPKFTSCIPR